MRHSVTLGADDLHFLHSATIIERVDCAIDPLLRGRLRNRPPGLKAVGQRQARRLPVAPFCPECPNLNLRHEAAAQSLFSCALTGRIPGRGIQDGTGGVPGHTKSTNGIAEGARSEN
jgi:hypothetical protein